MATRPFVWLQFSTLAEELGARAQEASRRTAISRAYYFVYHLARQRAEANRLVLARGFGSHKQVWDKCTASVEPDCRKLGEIAQRLKQKRERADYESFYARIGDDVPAILADAREFASRLTRLAARHPIIHT